MSQYQHTTALKLVTTALLAVASVGSVAGAYNEDFSDVYTTRSEEVPRYERVFKAGQDNAKQIIVQKNIVQAADIPDLRNFKALQTNSALVGVGMPEIANTPNTESSAQVAKESIQKVVAQTNALEKALFVSSLATGQVKIDVTSPNEVKNEWVVMSVMSDKAATLAQIARKLMPIGWRVDVRYASRKDMAQQWEFSVSDNREGALKELLQDTGYSHKYLFEHHDGTGHPMPLLIIHPETK